jgi:hypothetical protein
MGRPSIKCFRVCPVRRQVEEKFHSPKRNAAQCRNAKGIAKPIRYRTGKAAASPAVTVREWSICRELLRAWRLMMQAFKPASLNKLYRKLESVSIVIALLAVCGWIAYRHRPLPVSESAVPSVIPAKPQAPPSPTTEKPPTPQGSTRPKSPKFGFKPRRIGENEVDYVSDDVTIRQFRPPSAPKGRRSRNKPVDIRPDKSEQGARLDPLPEKPR